MLQFSAYIASILARRDRTQKWEHTHTNIGLVSAATCLHTHANIGLVSAATCLHTHTNIGLVSAATCLRSAMHVFFLQLLSTFLQLLSTKTHKKENVPRDADWASTSVWLGTPAACSAAMNICLSPRTSAAKWGILSRQGVLRTRLAGDSST